MKRSALLLLMLIATPLLFAQWSTNVSTPDALTVSGCEIFDSEIKTNSSGVSYIIYNTPVGDYIATYLQIVDKDGNRQFGEADKLIYNKSTRFYNMVNQLSMIDKEGNLIVAVTGCENAPEGTEALNYTIFKVSPTGKMLWGEEGVDLNRGNYHDMIAFMTITELEDGSYIFAWQDGYGISYDMGLYTSGIFSYTQATTPCEGAPRYVVKADRLSNSGEHLWDEPLIIDKVTSSCLYPHIVSAGSNQAIIVYAQGTNKNLLAHKIDFDGSAVWAEDTEIYKGGFSGNTPIYLMLSVQPAPNGGVFVGWYDDRYYSGAESAFLSHVGTDGSLLFNEGKAGLGIEFDEINRTLSYSFCYNEKENCLYALWRKVNSTAQSYQGVYMQKVSLNGEILWDSEGLAIQEVDLNYYKSLSIQNAEDGNVLVYFMKNPESGVNTEAFASKITPDGTFAWADSIMSLTPTANSRSMLESTALIDNSYWITTWKEKQEGDEFDRIYAHKLYTTQTPMGEMNVCSEATHFVARTTDNAVHFTTNSNETATITIYNIMGEVVATITTNGNTLYSTTGIAAGVYIATLQGGNVTSSTRFVVK